MRITLSVLLATLTIYCGASVLSLPPSLIATAASLARHHVRQTRNNRVRAGLTAGATTMHLPQQDIHTVAYPLSLHWQAARPKKDTADLWLDGDIGNIATNAHTGTDASNDDIMRLSSMKHVIKMTHPFKINSKFADVKDADESDNGNRKLLDEYDLNALLGNAADRSDWQQQPRSAQWWHIQAPRIRAMQMKEFFTPLKYWAHHCQSPDHNCPYEYHRAVLADRSRAAAAAAKLMDDFTASDGEKVKASAVNHYDDVNMNAKNAKGGDGSGVYNYLDNIKNDAAVDNVYRDADAAAEMANGNGGGSEDDNEDSIAANDILMLLSGEQDVIKFLSWAMEQLYPYQHFAQLNGSGQAESYYPGMFNWKKLNLSGHLEPPLVVEEPHYVIVRRERLQEELPGLRIEDHKPKQRSSLFQNIFNLNHGPQYRDDPFIPPRGRKHNLPDLDALLNRYETFVPNRGKRDKIKDIFKYDDLFFPNRGKKQKPAKATTLAPSEQLQHSGKDKANVVDTVDDAPESNVDQADGKRALLLGTQIDGGDDINLTVSPAAVAMSRILDAWLKRMRPHESRVSWKRLVSEAGDGNHTGTQPIGFDKTTDDNSKNYSDTFDSDIAVGDDYSSGNAEEVAASVTIGCPSRNAPLKNKKDVTEDNEQTKLSLPQVNVLNNFGETIAERPAGIEHFGRVANTFGGITQIAANRLRSMPAIVKSAERILQQQPTTPRYFSRPLRQRQAQRRAIWQLLLPSNQVRTNINDLDLLTWRQLRQMQQQTNSNEPLTVPHPPLEWHQHSPLQQERTQQAKWQQTEQQRLQHLFGGVEGIAGGHTSPDMADIGGI